MKDKISISDEDGKVPITDVGIFDKMTEEEALAVLEEDKSDTPAIDDLVDKFTKGGPGSSQKGHKTSDLRRHSQYTSSDYSALKKKGYTDKEIGGIWDKDKKSGKKPLHRKEIPKMDESIKAKKISERLKSESTNKTPAIDELIAKGGVGSGVKGHTTAKELAIKKKFGELDKARNKADALAEKDIIDGQRMIDKAAKESEAAFEEMLRLGSVGGSKARYEKISEKRERIKRQEKADWDLRIKGQNRKAEISDKYQAEAMKLMHLPKETTSIESVAGIKTTEAIPSVITYDSTGVSQVKYKGYRINRDETVKSRPYYSVIDHKVIKGSTPEILQKKIDSFLSKKDTKRDTKIKDEPTGKEQPTLTRDAPKHTPKSNLLATKHAEAAVKRGTLFKELGKKSKKELKGMIQQNNQVDMSETLRGMTKSNMKYHITSGKYPSPKGSEEAYNALTKQERKGLLKPIPEPKTPKAKGSEPPRRRNAPPIKAIRVEGIDAYESTHGKKPRGTGLWMFQIGEDSGNTYSAETSFKEAQKQAKKQAQKEMKWSVKLLP